MMTQDKSVTDKPDIVDSAPNDGPRDASDARNSYADWFDGARSEYLKDLEAHVMRAITEAIKPVADNLADFQEKLNATQNAMSLVVAMSEQAVAECARISGELARIKTDDEVLTQLQQRNHKLAEEFHETEVLTRVWHSLIGIADRCRNELRGIDATLQDRSHGGTSATITALRRLQTARQADCIELESVLADFGVERFEHPGGRFASDHQTCTQVITTDDPQLNQCIAERLHPGYKRDDRVVRPERVTVFVTSDADLNSRKGTE